VTNISNKKKKNVYVHSRLKYKETQLKIIKNIKKNYKRKINFMM
jgi:hypothetical protein